MCVCHRYIDPIKMWVYVHFSFTIWSMWLLWKHGVPFATLTPDLPHLPCRSASPPSRRAFAAAMSCGVDMRICLAAKLPQETRMLICVHLNIFIHILSIIYICIYIYIYISWIWRASLLQYVYIYILYMYVCMYVSYIDVLYTGQMRSLQIRGSMRRPTLPHKGKYAMKCAHIDDHRCEIVWLSINLSCVFLFLFFSPSIPL